MVARRMRTYRRTGGWPEISGRSNGSKSRRRRRRSPDTSYYDLVGALVGSVLGAMMGVVQASHRVPSAPVYVSEGLRNGTAGTSRGRSLRSPAARPRRTSHGSSVIPVSPCSVIFRGASVSPSLAQRAVGFRACGCRGAIRPSDTPGAYTPAMPLLPGLAVGLVPVLQNQMPVLPSLIVRGLGRRTSEPGRPAPPENWNRRPTPFPALRMRWLRDVDLTEQRENSACDQDDNEHLRHR